MDPTEPEQPSTSRDTVIIHAAESTSQVVGSSKRRLRSLPPKKSKGDEGKFVLYLPGLRTRLLNESSVRLSSPSSVPPSPSRRNLNSSPRRSSPREQPARATVIVSPTRNRNSTPSTASPLTSPSSMLKQLHLTKSTTMSPPSSSTTSPSSAAIRTNGTCTPPKQNFNSSSAVRTNGTCTPPRQNFNSSSAVRTNGTYTPPRQNVNSSSAIRTNGTCTPPGQNLISSTAIRTNGNCTPPRQNGNSSPPVASSTTSPSSSSTWVRTKGTWTPPREDLNSSPTVTSSSPLSSSQDPEKSPILRLLLTKDAKVSPSKYWKLKQQLAKNLTSSESAVSSTTSPLITMEQLAISLRIVTPPRNPSQRSARSSRGQNWRSAMKKKNSIVGKPTKKRGTCPKCHWILTVCQCNKKERN